MKAEHIKTEQFPNHVTYTLRVDGVVKTVSGVKGWPLDAALRYFPARAAFVEAFAACVKAPDNFIGQSYRAQFGEPV